MSRGFDLFLFRLITKFEESGLCIIVTLSKHLYTIAKNPLSML